MSRTICIVGNDTDPRTGRKQLVISHGIDEETLCNVPMPQVHPAELGAKFDMRIGEYVIEE